ncbi:MAG: ASKHA domain-containing protein, partial [Arenicellales bacterium]
MTDKVKIVFTPSGIRGEVDKGTDILTAARTLGADLDTVCGGNGVCGRCKIQISEGEFTKHQITSKGTHLSKLTTADIELFPSTKLSQGFRLGCRAKIMADVVVDIPPESQVHQQVVRKEAAALTIETKPAVKLYTVDVAEPQLDSSTGDLERLREAIEFEAGLQNLTFDFSILPVMQSVLRKGKWQVTLAVYADTRVIAIWPGEQTQRYGIAVDIGSTTLAGHLCDLNTGDVLASSGLMNPQIRFGEDVMSRVSYAMMNAGGDVEMTQAVRDGINAVIEDLLLQAKLEVEHVLDIVCVANPIMHHLILGIDPVELGGAPFALATQASLNLAARDLNLSLAKGARLYMLPCIAGHVGADAAAVALSEAPYKQEAITLIIDVGTNAEIILGNKDKCVSASAPTGPAFEGAQIEHGQRAAPGAIEKVRIDPITLEPKFKVIGIEEWSDEASFPEQAKKTGVTGICGSGIIEAIATLFLAGVIQADGVMNGAQAAQSSRIIKNDKT